MATARRVVLSLATGLVCATAGWAQNAGAAECLLFELTEEAGIARANEPVVLPAREVLARTRLRPIPCASLRLVGPTGEVPVQVDERDGAITWTDKPNGTLDDNDEIVFLASVPAGEVIRYRLCYGSVKAPGRPPGKSDLTWQRIPTARFEQVRHDAILGNAVLQAGIRAADSSDAQRVKLRTVYNRLEGTVVSLKVRKTQLLHPYIPLVSTWLQDQKPWHSLTRVSTGPVRMTAVAHKRLDGQYRHGNGAWSVTWGDCAEVKGDLYRSFTVYNGLPIIDIQDRVVARRVGDNFTMHYQFSPRPPVDKGASWETTREVLYPTDTRIVSRQYEADPKRSTRHPRADVRHGWIAARDRRTGLGLAVFYEPGKATAVKWALGRSWVKRPSPSWAQAPADLFVATYNRACIERKRGDMRFRLWVMTKETPAEIAAIHRAQMRYPLGATIRWSRAWKPSDKAPAVVPRADTTGKTLAAIRSDLNRVRARFAALPKLTTASARGALQGFADRLAKVEAIQVTGPVARRAREDRTSALRRDLDTWQAEFPLRRLALFERDTSGTQRGFTAFVEDTMIKVRPHGPIPVQPKRRAQVELARDEYEGFQVVLVPGSKRVEPVHVTVSDLVGPGGARMAAKTHVRRYRVGFVSPAKGGVPLAGKEWPDPLLPLPGCPDMATGTLFAPEARALDVIEPDRLAPYWFTVHAPRDAPAGTYRGTVTFTAPRGQLTMPVEATVFGFALPRKWTLKSTIWFNNGNGFYQYYGRFPTFDEYKRMVHLMDTYRVTSGLSWLSMTQLVTVTIERDGRYAFDFTKLDPWIELCLKRGNWFNVNFGCGCGWTGHFGGVFGRRTPILDKRTGKTALFPPKPMSETDMMGHDLFKAFWSAYGRHLKQKGWLDRCYLENVDEPPYGQGYKNAPRNVFLRAFHSRVRKLAPDVCLFNYGMDPSPWMHGWAADYVDAWGPGLSGLERSKAHLHAHKAKGKFFVPYICGGSPRTAEHHVPDVLISNPGIDLRVVPWMIHHYGGSGVLYYSANGWVGDSQVKFVEKVPAKRWPAKPWHLQGCGFGNGWFTYPAPKCLAVYPSVRLENIRDGLEDHEYLTELARRVGPLTPGDSPGAKLRRNAKRLLSLDPMVRTVLDWSEDIAVLRRRRRAIARAIESRRSHEPARSGAR